MRRIRNDSAISRSRTTTPIPITAIPDNPPPVLLLAGRAAVVTGGPLGVATASPPGAGLGVPGGVPAGSF